ncbi:cytochrome P450 [Thamnocephalis sphaerospora]|uniref:Cytochrome P450 n=1 Tax=Thamnocephalis sphaerospora TaxID=78915 RepID=A0A4P9XP83_9FUNG|nr:cytochrome P450 [Thamnocephalis sphaerospora]|eukprot:RKP07804.1 cytochrome P450 [Thamnocephalis sphaerospora]
MIFDGSFWLTVFLAWLAYKIITQEFLSPLSKLPGIRPVILSEFLINLSVLRGDMGFYIADLHRKYGPIVRLNEKDVSVIDIDAIRTLGTNTKYLKSANYDSFQVHTDSIFSTRDPDFHRMLKRLIAPAFSLSSIASMESIVADVGVRRLARRISEHAKANETFDLMAYLHYMAFDLTGEISMGQSFGILDQQEHPIIHWIEDVTVLCVIRFVIGRLCQPWLLPGFFKSQQSVVDFARSAIISRKTSSTSRADVLQRLMDATDPETGARLSEDQLIAESIVQFVAGTETTALTLTWTMHYLLSRPECIEKLFDELEQAIPDLTTDVTYDSVKDLLYLEAVLTESMRLCPVAAAGNQRAIPEGGMTVGQYHVPEGYQVIPAVIALQRRDDIFPNPDAFEPERWLGPAAQVAEMKRAYMPFSLGTRACIGRNLAWVEMKMTLATLVRRYHFTVPEDAKSDMTPMFRFTYKPKGGKLLVQATPRVQ